MKTVVISILLTIFFVACSDSNETAGSITSLPSIQNVQDAPPTPPSLD